MPAKNNVTGSSERGNEELIERLHDLMDQAQRTYQPMITSFLTPAQLMCAVTYIGRRMTYTYGGGYAGAEHCRLKLFPPYTEVDEDFQIVLLKARLHPRYDKITHRDVLGAMMKLGVSRDVFGDILIKEDALYVYVAKHMADFFMMELTRVRHSSVTLECCDEEVIHEAKYEEFHPIISSARCDAVVSACAHISRAKAKELIQRGLVKINHVILEQCDRICNNMSTISIRGYGRFVFVEISHTTKKGNFVAVIRKMR